MLRPFTLRFVVLLTLALLLLAACSDGTDNTADTTLAPTTTAAESTTTTVAPTTVPETTSTTEPATTSLPDTPEPPTTLFAMTQDEITAASNSTLEIASTVAQGLESRDLEILSSAFTNDGYVIDPVKPSRQPPLSMWFSLFEGMCSAVTTHDLYVNVDGSAAATDCYGFYDIIGDGLPDPIPGIRHVWSENGVAERMIVRLDAEMLAEHPSETSDAIGFMVSATTEVGDQAQTALSFATRFAEAWNSGDVSRIIDLYAADGVRHDPFAGLSDDREAMTAWFHGLANNYPETSIQIESLQASGPGPSAAYKLTVSDGSDPCSIQMVSAWDLDDDELITREYVFYHPDSVLNCDWTPSS